MTFCNKWFFSCGAQGSQDIRLWKQRLPSHFSWTKPKKPLNKTKFFFRSRRSFVPHEWPTESPLLCPWGPLMPACCSGPLHILLYGLFSSWSLADILEARTSWMLIQISFFVAVAICSKCVLRYTNVHLPCLCFLFLEILFPCWERLIMVMMILLFI